MNRSTFALVWLFVLSLVACRMEEEPVGAFVHVPSTGGIGVTVSGTPDAGQVLTATGPTSASWQTSSGGGGAPSGSAGGDLMGTFPDPGVAKINGSSVPAGGALTTGAVLRATGAAALGYGAVDLANANAVTGVLPSANLATATSGAAGALRLTGNLGGTASSPTVVGLTIPSEAQGDLFFRGSSSWGRLGAGTAGQALLTGGAGADPAWGTSFGANNLVTTGTVSLGTTPSTAGANINVPNASTIISARNFAGSGNISVLSTNSSNTVFVGEGAANSTLQARAGTSVQLVTGSQIHAFTSSSWSFGISATVDPVITHTTNATASYVGRKFSLLAQSCSGTTSTGGDLEIGPGTGTSTNGNLRIVNVATTTSAPSAGAAGALPATPAGYVTIYVNGTARQLPYY